MAGPAISLHPPDARLLEGRTAIVSGATSGIGQGIALELGAHGAGVAFGYRSDPETATRMAEALVALGRRATAVRMDVASEDEVSAAFARARDELGAIDLVVANARREAEGPLVEMSGGPGGHARRVAAPIGVDALRQSASTPPRGSSGPTEEAG